MRLIKIINNSIVILSIAIVFIRLLLPEKISSEEKMSPRFRLDDETIMLETKTENTEPKKNQDEIIQMTDPLFDKNGIRITYGYPHTSETEPTNVKLSKSIIDFDIQESNRPTETVLLTYGGNALSYTASMTQNHDLIKLNGKNIMKTICDDHCSGYNAGIWRSSSVYGLGYNVSGNDHAEDFLNEDYYRSIIDQITASNPIIMRGVNSTSNRTGKIEFKLNLPENLETGTYENVITVTVLPGY